MRTNAHLAIGGIALLLTSFVPSQIAEDPEAIRARHERAVREYIELTHGREALARAMEVQFEMLEKMPVLGEKFAEAFRSRFDFDHLVEKTVEAFMEHVEVETLEATNQFFRTPHGQAFARGSVEATLAMQRYGQEYGERIGREAAEELTR